MGGEQGQNKQPIASYFENHHHQREIFQNRWREGVGAKETEDPASAGKDGEPLASVVGSWSTRP